MRGTAPIGAAPTLDLCNKAVPRICSFIAHTCRNLTLPHATLPIRNELKPARLVPDVLSALQLVAPTMTEQEGNRLLHPADIFRSVFQELMESGIQLCEAHQAALAAAHGDLKAEADTRLRRSLRSFHTCLADYINACRTISKIVAGGEKAARTFRSNAGEYYDHVMMVDNFIKHQHRTVRTVYAHWPRGQIIGYQIEAAIGEGAVGAEPKIHRYPGTAFSINRALAYHACSIFFIATTLRTTLQLPVGTTSTKESGALHGLVAAFLDQVSAVPRLYLPDEIHLPSPLVRKQGDGTYLLKFPSQAKPLNHRPHVLSLTFVSHVSRHTRVLEIPYLSTHRPWAQ